MCLHVADLVGADRAAAKIAARGLAFALLIGVVARLCRDEIAGPLDLCRRVFVIITVLYLLSPTQFPWYYLWLAPFLPLFPVSGLLLLTATLPLYYSYFHLAPRDMEQVFHYGVVLVIWVPVLMLLGRDVYRHVAARGPGSGGGAERQSVHGGRS